MRGSPKRCWLAVVAIVVVSPLMAAQRVPLQSKQSWRFAPEGVRFTNQFAEARLNGCDRLAAREFRLVIRPENRPVNNSAWYAFRIDAESAVTITVHLTYEGGRHRYYPQVSRDRRQWRPLERGRYVHDRQQETATLTLEIDGERPLWVAAQELIGVAEVDAWSEKIAQKPFARQSTIGQSLLGHPLRMLTIGDPAARDYVFIISRQHPPEITGTLALMAFVDQLCAALPLSNTFRERFATAIVPLVNPDGVSQGHWRHNMNGVDLNRDWRLFAQPETRQVRDALIKLAAAPGSRPFLFLDFHSTHRNLFYTQADRHVTFPKDFTRRWLAAFGQRFPEYTFRRQGSHNPRGGTSKSWAYEQFGIPAITYEVGDGTDRKLIERATRGSAEEVMKLLLAASDANPRSPSQ